MLDRGNLFGELVLWHEGENIQGGQVVYLHSPQTEGLQMLLGVIRADGRQLFEALSVGCYVPPEDWLNFPWNHFADPDEVPF